MGYPMDLENQLLELTGDIVKKIVSGYSPQKIILFGSLAYGTPTKDSDVDLLIIKDTDKRPIERWMEVKKLLRDPNRMRSISPLVYTTQEINERIAIKDFFIQEVLEKGKVLYG
jgi:predicted nucleotidyltransferase